MLVSFKETKLQNITSIVEEYNKLGFYFDLSGKVHLGRWKVQLLNGDRQMDVHVPKSNTGISFTVYEDLIEIHEIHVNQCKRKQGLSRRLLQPLINFYKKMDLKGIKVSSINDSFWLNIVEKYPDIMWMIFWKDHTSFRKQLAILGADKSEHYIRCKSL